MACEVITVLTRRVFLRSSMVLAGLAVLGGCRHTVDVGSPVLSFLQEEASCSFAGPDDAQVQAAAGGVHFSGRMTMPDPCHQLEAMLETKNQTFIVHITAVAPKSPDGFCIQCVGQAPYSGQIINVRPGQYTIKIRHGGREIKTANVTVL